MKVIVTFITFTPELVDEHKFLKPGKTQNHPHPNELIGERDSRDETVSELLVKRDAVCQPIRVKYR